MVSSQAIHGLCGPRVSQLGLKGLHGCAHHCSQDVCIEENRERVRILRERSTAACLCRRVFWDTRLLAEFGCCFVDGPLSFAGYAVEEVLMQPENCVL